jgi:phosphatidylserine/phosphatidylglycerophosphate/cardiolipin synthase-like enzyme
VELIVQPADGPKILLDALAGAQKSIDIMIFRMDLKTVERALETAATRGVAVRALIARESSLGDKRLRQLEMRMLEKGVIVARTGDAFVRYHGKMLILDREELHVYGFNFTALDFKSRSFGIVTKERKLVTEAIRLFEADVARKDYEPLDEEDNFVVSPETAREQLSTFIKRAKKQLLIYDPKVADVQMFRLLAQRIKAGVDVRILGKVGKRGGGLRVQKQPGMRLHVRSMIRDGDTAFVGSQSLRTLELDGRREVGILVKEPKIVKRMAEIFEEDWAKTDLAAKEAKDGKKELKEERKELKEERKEAKKELASVTP